MRIAVLGTFLKDRIIDLQGRVTESKGGLFYSVDALRAVCAENDQIIPISYVGKDFYRDVVLHFKGDARLKFNGLFEHDGPNNCVELKYFKPEVRTERSLNPMPPLTFAQLEPFLDADVFIFNFISGWEMNLEEFRMFASAFSGLSALDIHSLTLKRLDDGRRQWQKVANIDQWIEFVKIVHCNETEFKMVTDLDVKQFYKMFCYNQKKIVNLTYGKYGSLHVYRLGREIKWLQIQAEKRVNVVDPTGCGDVFLAGFVYFYALGQNVKKAAQKAAVLSAVAGSVKGLPQVSLLSKKFNQLIG